MVPPPPLWCGVGVGRGWGGPGLARPVLAGPCYAWLDPGLAALAIWTASGLRQWLRSWRWLGRPWAGAGLALGRRWAGAGLALGWRWAGAGLALGWRWAG